MCVPQPASIRIGWGSYWKDGKWSFEQSSGVLSLHGQVPFYGESSKVALCGMMSERKTPYSSIEAAIEVGRSFCHETFETRKTITTSFDYTCFIHCFNIITNTYLHALKIKVLV